MVVRFVHIDKHIRKTCILYVIVLGKDYSNKHCPTLCGCLYKQPVTKMFKIKIQFNSIQYQDDEYSESGVSTSPRGQEAFCGSEDQLYYSNKNPECSL